MKHNGRMPLEGIRVVDLTIWAQGPLGAMMLADLGAEVIKVEKPGQGDFSRGVQSLFGKPQFLPDGKNLMFEITNRNKKAVSLDLRKPEGQQAFYRLIEKSDVFISNLHPSALREFQVDRKTLLEINPDLIYSHATGFGPRGPHAEDPCQDTVGMARSGFMFNTPEADGSPVYPTGALSDILSGTMLGFGVIAALLARERTGVTQSVYASQLSTMMWLQYYNLAQYSNVGEDFEPYDRHDVANPLMNLYKCADDRWIACGLFVAPRFWSDFCQVMGLADIEHDPRFTNDEKRTENRKALITYIEYAFATQPRDYWEKIFRDKGFWFAVVNKVSDLPDDPQVIANAYLMELDNGLKTVSAPFSLEKTPPLQKGAPDFSQHTDEILQEVCGYSMAEIVALKEKGVAW